MNLPKEYKDIVYNLLKEPTLEKFREFIKAQIGETDFIDFKEKWLSNGKLAKEVLAMANSGGGVIVFGIKENKDHTFSCVGLDECIDKSEVYNKLSSFISKDLKYDTYNFIYEDSEYAKLKSKKFQMIIIQDIPNCLPFVSRSDGDGIYKGRIYVRHGTSCLEVDESDIAKMISRRVNAVFPESGRTLDLKEHLGQLEELYKHINETKITYGSILEKLSREWPSYRALGALGTTRVHNSLYPEETFEKFVSRMISEKKKKIEKILDLK